MPDKGFTVEIDGREVRVDQENGEVRILDEGGAAMFHDLIQVAAGSVQGMFSAFQDATTLGLDSEPNQHA